ncbi:MAG: hypothetical protein A2Y62_07475 [Candidatus Fischerbacteria bacterium RBG_13_37_8]|uniref:Peptidase M1 membrane alanine aminopeptidase domain-containing protein n=1 Tax=Candidatus Fischerbacteria bacterium RBG_13_37_8 TaxID=1817863 RepID=A0A1F5VI69_9BACT|nr:MAG: hypothetical protein A2Y62_07475 [Candidatus Fischerbacteria bacterium RBG_13_37_8]
MNYYLKHLIFICIFVIGSTNISLFSSEITINDVLIHFESAIKQKNKESLLSVFQISGKEAENRVNEFAKKYFEEITYSEFYLNYKLPENTEMMPDRLTANAVFLDGALCVIEVWDIFFVKDNNSFLISRIEKISRIPRVKRYVLNTDKIFDLRNLTLKITDGELHFKHAYLMKEGETEKGSIFLLIGSGKFTLTPSVEYETGQMKLISGKEYFDDKIEQAIMATNSSNIKDLFTYDSMVILHETEKILPEFIKMWEKEKENQLQLSWLEEIDKNAIWNFALDDEAIKIKIKTKKFGMLNYYYGPNLPFPVQLYRENPYIIYSFYNPLQKKGQAIQFNFGLHYNVDYYDTKVDINPETNFFKGTTSLVIKSLIENLSNVELNLNDKCTITEIIDQDYETLLYFQNNRSRLINVYLKKGVRKNETVTLEISYSGIIMPSRPFQDYMQDSLSDKEPKRYVAKQISFYEGSLFWYPQSILPEFSKGKIEIVVPPGYFALATGSLKYNENKEHFSRYVFESEVPAKHFSLMLTRNSSINIKQYNSLRLILERGSPEKEIYEKVIEILDFYEKYIGKLSFPTLDLYYHFDEFKGGYAQAGFIILINKHPLTRKVFRGSNPLEFPQFGDFYLAHELAHLWWGHTVSYLTYQDQWISEGLAHFLAAKYIEYSKGKEAYYDLLKKFSDTAKERKDSGPIILGRRLGLVNKDNDAYSAIVYNKTAVVLAMLEEFIGENAFVKTLQDFYQKYRFQFASTYDFITIAQQNCQCGLGKFFTDWYYSSNYPQVQLKKSIRKNSVQLSFRVIPSFVVAVPVDIYFKDGSDTTITFIVVQQNQRIESEFDKEIDKIMIREIYPYKY